jgi:hypothetical protein
MVFSRFLSRTIFIPAENTWHSEKPGQNPMEGQGCSVNINKSFVLKVLW